jgi:hypothetical protein
MVSPAARSPSPVSSSRPAGLLLGLLLGYVVFLAVLGLRWSLILLGGLPPVAAEVLWRRRDSRRRAAEVDQLAAGSPLDAAVLSLRLEQIVCQELPAWAKPIALQGQPGWERFCWLLESIRDLAARCAELDPTSSVDLILLMEELLDLARHQVLLLQQRCRAPTESARQLCAIRADGLECRLREVLHGLTSAHDEVLDQSLHCSGLPIRLALPPFKVTP